MQPTTHQESGGKPVPEPISAAGRQAPEAGPDLTQSAAGEEDPGASIDIAASGLPGRSDQPDQPAGRRGDEPSGAAAPMSPGDDAPPGTPGTGENVCPRCGGSGTLAGRACPECEGVGKVTVGIGGA